MNLPKFGQIAVVEFIDNDGTHTIRLESEYQGTLIEIKRFENES